MSKRPTHVMVSCPTGEGADHFAWPMPLEDFAKLFTYGQVHVINDKGQTTAIRQEIMAAQAPTGGDPR